MEVHKPFQNDWLQVNDRMVIGLTLWLACAAFVAWTTRRPLRRYAAPMQKPTKETAKPDLEEADLSNVVRVTNQWTEAEPIAYRPWTNGPYHVTMALKTVRQNEWIEIDDTYLAKYQLKRHLYRQHRHEVLSVLPGCEAGLHEAVHLLKNNLVRRYPRMFRLRSAKVIENLVTGDVWDLHLNADTWQTHHPLEIMGLLASEDFYILQNEPQGGSTRLVAATSCFPAGFKIDERVGGTLWDIHAGKVPQYETKLAKSMDRYFQKLRVDSPIQRFNYAIDDSNELFHRHPHHNLSDEHAANLTIDDLYLRVERQVLQRLPKSRYLLFSIRTYVTPMSEVTQDEAMSRALWTSVSSYSEDVAKYKNKGLWNDILRRHLHEKWDMTNDIYSE